jgi:hypothetical protein
MVDRTLRIAEQPKPRATAWQGFAEYREFLVRSLDRLQTNASAHQRKVRYALLGSVSSGYDSAAATALAAEVGCRHALTFRQGSAYVNGAAIVADSGAEVGRILGLSVREFDKRDFRAADPIIAAETAACGDSYDLQLGAFERDLAQTAFITGFRGDGVWSRLPGERHPLITDGSSLGEFRLRVGFVHVPVPFIGFERRADILAISNSEEMRPWMVGTDYDRPIPRRILEEKGVPRHLFGQTKKGSFRAVQPDDDFNVEVSEFEEFYREHRRAAPLGRRMVVRMRYVLHRLASRMACVAHRFGGPPRLYTMTSLDVAVPGRRTLVVQWGNRVLQARYRIAEDDQSTLTDPQC